MSATAPHRDRALIVPLDLMRSAIAQSTRMGMPESRQDVIERVLGDLRTTDHPAARAVLSPRHDADAR